MREALSKHSKKTKKILIIICLISILTGRAEADVLNITVTSPWLAILVNFIGGVNVEVASIQDWNNAGELVRRINARGVQALPENSLIMAFDHHDARALGIPIDRHANFRTLYNRMPLDAGRIDAYMSDPSVIPFIAQRVLMVLADWDPSNYPFYQRRLAEFQARLHSTILAGRQMLRGQRVLDLTGHSRTFLQAAGFDIVRPSNEEWAAWSARRNLNQLTGTVSRMAEERAVIVMDNSTPRAILNALNANPAVFLITRPRINQDYPAFLHDQYLSLWSRTTLRPQPGSRR